MEKTANLVIIGAGIVGTSSAYHLTKLNWKNIIVIDQGDLFHTGGSTSHAPGTLFQLNPSKMMTNLSKYTHDLYDNFSVNGVKALERVGTLQLAHTKERLEDMKRLNNLAVSWDLETDILSPEESVEKLPILNKEGLLGSLYTPSDGVGRAVIAAEAMAHYAEEKGAAKFYGGVRVEGFDIKNGAIHGVITNKGRIDCGKVLLCGGIWGPKLGDMIGVNIPLQPTQHLYLKTNPIDDLNQFSDQGKIEITLPSLRAQDHGCYYRQHFNMWGIGSYNHDPISMSAHDILRHEDSDTMPAIRKFTPEHYSVGEKATHQLFPCTKSKGYSYKINGVFSFLPDGFPLMGELKEIKGFWSCEAIWIMHSGGAGKVIAEWMDQGHPPMDMHEADINRFNDFQSRSKYVQVTSEQSYREVHDIIHPQQPMLYPINLRRSPFYNASKEFGAEFFRAAGWERPEWFESNANLGYDCGLKSRQGWEAQYWSPTEIQEHLAVRKNAGLFDISAFTKFEIIGPDSLKFLQRVCVNNINIDVGSIIYTSLVNPQGRIECDLTISRLEANRFLVLTGAGSGARDLNWLQIHLGDDQTHIVDVTSTYAGLGLWGPKARQILEKIADEDISNEAFPFYKVRNITIGYVPVIALRISYIGELGWELYCPTEFGQQLYEVIMNSGKDSALIPAGNGVYDSMRIEKSYRLLGADIHADYNPYEAGLGWSVKLDKSMDFIGKSALIKIKAEGIQKKLCCLTLDEDGIYNLGKEPVFHENKKVSYVTSANTGYSVKKHISMAYLPIELSAIGTQLEIEYFGKRLPATVTEQNLFDPKNLRLKS